MRTLLLTPVFPPARGGIETLAGQLARRLPQEVRVVTLSSENVDPAPTGTDSPHAVVRVRDVPRGGRRSILHVNARAILDGIRHRPDVVVVLHVKLAPAALLLARMFHVPVVQYVHAKEMREVPELARLAVRTACEVIAVSSYSRELAEDAGAPHERIQVIHNGVELPANRPIVRSSSPTLITVSRLEDRYKGHDVFLEAMPAVRQRIPNIRWLIIGDGSLREELEQRAVGLGVGECVSFVGGVSDADRDELLDSAWAFVMLSREPPGRRSGEGFGIAYVEAGAHGLPVIAGRVPGVLDAVEDGVTGILIDPTDVAEAAAAATALLSDDGLRRRLGDGGMARAKELAWPGVVQQVHEVLEDCLRRHPVRPSSTGVGWGWARELLGGTPIPDDLELCTRPRSRRP